MMNANSFVCELSKENQEKIKNSVKEYLIKEGYNKDYIEETVINAMEGRLWNVEEIVDIKQFFMDGNVIYMKDFVREKR